MIPTTCRNASPHLSLFLILISFARAADWPPITPDQKSTSSVSQQPDAPAVIFYREDTTDDSKNFRSVYVRLKVLTEAGKRYQDVEIPVGHNAFTVSQVSGRTVQPDGQIVPWDGQPIDKIVVRDHGLRLHVKSFTLPAVAVGSILDYRYSLHFAEDSRNAPEWLVQNELFQKRVVFKFIPTKYQPKVDSLRGDTGSYDRIGNSNLEQVNSEYTWINHLPAGKQPEDHMTAVDQYKWVGFEMNDVPPAAYEPDQPPPIAVSWRVDFFYRTQAKPDTYWKAAGKNWDKEVESFLSKKGGVSEAVTKLVEAGDNPEAKLRKIYDFVSQLQNQSFSASAPAIALAPAAGAEEVLKNRGGTHDELNRLFLAMVRAAGIPAAMMWVPDRGKAPFDIGYMTTDQFVAEISVVQLGGQDVFLDPGTKFCPYGLLPWHYAGVRGMRQNTGANPTLVDTPAPTYKGALIQRVARVQVMEKGMMQGQVAIGYAGQEAMTRREMAAGLSPEDRQRFLEHELASWLPPGTTVHLTNTPDWDKTEGTLAAQFKVTGPLATGEGGKWQIPAQIFETNSRARFTSAQRTSPVFFDYASRRVDEVHISLPDNIAADNMPAARQAKTPYALYVSEQKSEGPRGIVSTRDIAMNGVLFTPNEYKDLKEFYDKVADGDKGTVPLKGSL